MIFHCVFPRKLGKLRFQLIHFQESLENLDYRLRQQMFCQESLESSGCDLDSICFAKKAWKARVVIFIQTHYFQEMLESLEYDINSASLFPKKLVKLGYAGEKKASETTDIIRQNERLLYLKELNKCIVLFTYFHTKENLYLSDSKMRINAFIWEGLCMRGLYMAR